MNHFVYWILLCLLAVSCRNKSTGAANDVLLSPEEILAEMRADSSWINTLDSMASANIGDGARCLDPVKHLFVWDDRYWLYNQDWGGVLELPEGFIPEDDLYQTIVSFHGTHIWSPDTMTLVSVYAGFQDFTYDEVEAFAIESLTDDSMIITDISKYPFICNGLSKGNELRIKARNDNGITGLFRYITYNGPLNVEYDVSLQYPEEDSDMVAPLIDMVYHYPSGPNGQLPDGWCFSD